MNLSTQTNIGSFGVPFSHWQVHIFWVYFQWIEFSSLVNSPNDTNNTNGPVYSILNWQPPRIKSKQNEIIKICETVQLWNSNTDTTHELKTGYITTLKWEKQRSNALQFQKCLSLSFSLILQTFWSKDF